MFRYTRAAINRIIIDARALAHIANIVMQSIMIAYLVFSIIIERGSPLINGILLGLTAANLVFYLVTYGRVGAKRLRQRVSRTYVAAKLSVNLIPLASIAYSVYVGASDVTSLALILTPLMIILWVLQLAFNLARVYIENRAALFMDGIEMDMECIKSPIRSVKNRIHDFFGEEHEAQSNVSEKNREILTRHAEDKKADRREKKVARRARRRRRWATIGHRIKGVFVSEEGEEGSEPDSRSGECEEGQ